MREQTEKISEYSDLLNRVALTHMLNESALYIEQEDGCDYGQYCEWQSAACLIGTGQLLN